MKKGDKVGIVCCSNGQALDNGVKLQMLGSELLNLGLIPTYSRYIYMQDGIESENAMERALVVKEFYEDDSIKAVFDISGGDIANTILPFLDYDLIAESCKPFWGYSDLTTVINAIYAKTGQPSVLYQIKNLVWDNGDMQKKLFQESVMDSKQSLFEFSYKFYQGQRMEGIVLGGNVRCFLKLAGTPYFPDLTGKILFLESLGGAEAQMLTYFSQLGQMGVFDKVAGVLLGTFTQMEAEYEEDKVYQILRKTIGSDLPVAKTGMIGHGNDSRAIWIGKKYELEK